MVKSSNKRWIKKHLSDNYVKKARLMGFRSRAAFKLLEIDEGCNLIKPNLSILDLGAAPGSWSQVISKKLNKKINSQKNIVAVDILPIEPIVGITFIQGDFTDLKTIKEIRDFFKEDKIDLILSDISPNLTGIGIADSMRINHLGELVLEFCKEFMSIDGTVLLKTFHGSGYSQLVENYKKVFSQVTKKKPSSSRSESAEVFIIAKNLKN